jgi:serine/threonine-protein kinase
MKDPIPFGKYLLTERIDVGGTAEVFTARGPGGVRCAVKRLLPGLAADRDVVAMFLAEARLGARLSHPGIVRILDVGRVGQGWYLAMEYVPGADLAALLTRLRAAGRRLPVPVSAWIAAEVARALAHAHALRDPGGRLLGVAHGDISPQNVLVSFAGEVKLIDFGLAGAEGAPGGALRGKLGYMSAEQAEGRPPDRRSDLFSLGVVLHEMLAGERLFHGGSPLETLERVRRAPVPPPSAANPEVAPGLDAVVLRALAREPAARPAGAAELADALGPFADPRGPSALREVVTSALPVEAARERAGATG